MYMVTACSQQWGLFSHFPSPMGTPWIQSLYTTCHILIWSWVLNVGTGSLHRPGPTSSPPLPVSLPFLKLPDRVDCPHLSGTMMEKIKNLCMVPRHVPWPCLYFLKEASAWKYDVHRCAHTSMGINMSCVLWAWLYMHELCVSYVHMCVCMHMCIRVYTC